MTIRCMAKILEMNVAENVAERNPNYEVSEMDRVKATIQKEAVGLDDHSYQAAMPA